MDSDDEITDSDVLDWYSGRVTEIWDSALDSFSDLDASLVSAFREVMENIQHRSQQGTAGSGPENQTNGETPSPGPSDSNPVTVTLTQEQLMSALEEDEDWLDTAEENEDENPITVKLAENDTLPKNVKRASRDSDLQKSHSLSLTGSKCLGHNSFFLLVFQLTKLTVWITTSTLIFYLILVSHNPSQRFISRHIQNYIHPMMRALRLATLPWVQKYPSISDWHEETCLISNPWYWTRPLDCTTCRTVTIVNVLNDSGTFAENFGSAYYHSGKPFIVKAVSLQNISLDKLNAVHQKQKSLLYQGIARFKSSDSRFRNITDVVENMDLVMQLPKLHLSWRISRNGAARLLRQLFPRPEFIPPDTEVALHKYLFIDGSQSPPYQLPVTEFANVWIVQGYGRRTFQLKPSVSCKDVCSSISVEISRGDIMYYNWQFWEMQSLPAEGADQMSITYVGSFY